MSGTAGEREGGIMELKTKWKLGDKVFVIVSRYGDETCPLCQQTHGKTESEVRAGTIIGLALCTEYKDRSRIYEFHYGDPYRYNSALVDVGHDSMLFSVNLNLVFSTQEEADAELPKVLAKIKEETAKRANEQADYIRARKIEAALEKLKKKS